MRIVSVYVFKCVEGQEPIILSSADDLSFVGIFKRGTLREFATFNSRLVAGRTPVDQNLQVDLTENKVLCYSTRNAEYASCIITDQEYPKRVAMDLNFKILENLNSFIYSNKININSITSDTNINFTFLQTVVKEWQNPSEKDNILKLQSELNDVTDIMKKNLNELLKREENLDNLMEKSKDLSTTSVQFYKQAKKTNSCCNF